jgi:DNA (cytosine-5)-methyltransferase 1
MKPLLCADLFCGAGGASTSLLRAATALGLDVKLVAVNHWPTAIETHTMNHPGVRHLCESVERVNPREVVPGGRLHLLMAGPECTNHSRARGGRPVNDQSRASAWHILKWCQELYIDNVLIENVEEFREWGPLGANGKPLKSKKGLTYKAFLEALRSLGYAVEDRVLCAADYGDPTTRRRLFIIARRGRRAVEWPMPTHSKMGGRTLFGLTKKWRAAREVIDFAIPSRSIFDPTRRPLSPKTIARILAGLERFGGEALKPFLVVLRNHADGRSLDRPLPTLAAQGQHVALVEPFLMHITHGTDVGRTHPLDNPVPTVTGAHRGEIALCEPFMLSQASGGAPRHIDQPVPTICTDGAHSLVEPFMVAVAHGDNAPGSGRGNGGRVRSVDDPLPVVTASGREYAVVEPFLVPHYGERDGQTPRTHSVDDPMPTIPATGSGKFDVVQPFLASYYYGTKNISPVSAPVPTITTKDRFALVLPVINGMALDIRLRMLKPSELARATSFPESYRFAGNQGDQVKQIGNAWPGELGLRLTSTLIKAYAPARGVRGLEVVA